MATVWAIGTATECDDFRSEADPNAAARSVRRDSTAGEGGNPFARFPAKVGSVAPVTAGQSHHERVRRQGAEFVPISEASTASTSLHGNPNTGIALSELRRCDCPAVTGGYFPSQESDAGADTATSQTSLAHTALSMLAPDAHNMKPWCLSWENRSERPVRSFTLGFILRDGGAARRPGFNQGQACLLLM